MVPFPAALVQVASTPVVVMLLKEIVPVVEGGEQKGRKVMSSKLVRFEVELVVSFTIRKRMGLEILTVKLWVLNVVRLVVIVALV